MEFTVHLVVLSFDVHTFTSRLQPFLYMRHANKKTVLVNSPPEEEKTRLIKLLTEIKEIEDKILNLDC